MNIRGQRSRVMRIRACPPGTILVRDEDDPSGDECSPCPSGTYSLERPQLRHGLVLGEAVGVATSAVEGVSKWCLPCPEGSACINAGGNSNVTAKTGFWRQPGCMQCQPEACHDDWCDPRLCEDCKSESASDATLATGSHDRLRAIVLSCPPGVCEDGGCVGINDGPVCGRSSPTLSLGRCCNGELDVI